MWSKHYANYRWVITHESCTCDFSQQHFLGPFTNMHRVTKNWRCPTHTFPNTPIPNWGWTRQRSPLLSQISHCKQITFLKSTRCHFSQFLLFIGHPAVHNSPRHSVIMNNENQLYVSLDCFVQSVLSQKPKCIMCPVLLHQQVYGHKDLSQDSILHYKEEKIIWFSITQCKRFKIHFKKQ